MTAVTGAGTLTLFVLRRDRLRSAVWVIVLAGLVAAAVRSLDALYPTRADRELYEAMSAVVTIPQVLNGPLTALDTLGGMTVFEVGWYVAIAAAVLSISATVRTLRGDEEEGRTELLRSAVVGRHAGLVAALASTMTVQLVLAAVVSAAMVLSGLPVAGSVAYGAALLGVGAVFAGVGAVTSQLTEHARTAYAMGGAALGVAFALRAVGDVGEGGRAAVSWLSPLGWAQAVRPFGQERWWPLLITSAATAVLVGAAALLERRRDVGAGLVRPRPGPAVAAPWISGPTTLALRLLRGAVLTWAVILLVAGGTVGALASDMGEVVATSEGIGELFGDGADPVEAYLSLMALALGVATAGFVVSALLRLRSEELADRAEPVLAAPVSRWRWAGGHVLVVVAGSVVVALGSGLGLGAAHALRSGESTNLAQGIAAVLAHLPAIWVVGAVTALLLGFVPRAGAASWAMIVGSLVVAFLAPMLDLPGWAVDLSPFTHSPALPGGDVDAGSVLAWAGAAVLGVLAGVVGLRRRDLG